MIVKQPIKCSKCGATVVDDMRNLSNYVMLNDIKCFCGEVVVYKNETIC